MTRPLRRAHYRVWLILALLLPLLLGAGLLARKPPDVNPNLHWKRIK